MNLDLYLEICPNTIIGVFGFITAIVCAVVCGKVIVHQIKSQKKSENREDIKNEK